MNRSFLYLILSLLCTISYAQQAKEIKVHKGVLDLKIIPENQEVEGHVVYHFSAQQPTKRFVIDAQFTQFDNVLLNGKKAKFTVTDSTLVIAHIFKPNTVYQLSFKYHTKPKKAMYFIGWNQEETEVERQVWTQGQGKYSSNWVPSFDDVNQKVEFDISIEFPKAYTVLANGKLIDKKEKETTTIWQYDMQKPMSSYLLAVVAGEFATTKATSASGVPLAMYIAKKDTALTATTYQHSTAIFNFLENKIGFQFPWQSYKQVPVKDFMYGGMENTTCTIFNEMYVVDSIGFTDQSFVNVNAHELAHQWFGDLVTEATPEDHWLQEGFATFYAQLADEHVFGKAYCNDELYNNAKQLLAQEASGKSESLLKAKASSLTFYQKGALALWVLRDIMGEKSFDQGIKAYLNTFQYENVTTNDFLTIMQSYTKEDLNTFKQRWLVATEFYEEDVWRILTQRDQAYEQLITLNSLSEEAVLDWFQTLDNPYIKTNIVYESTIHFSDALVQDIVHTHHAKLHQALLQRLDTISLTTKPMLETLLDANSYLTQEMALMRLWGSFPEDQNRYLDHMKGRVGLKDRNLQVLWTVLALASQTYEVNNKGNYFMQLTAFTSPKYNFQTREHAFSFLIQLQLYNDTSLRNLVQACVHHSWRFASSARDILAILIKDEVYHEKLKSMLPYIPINEQKILESRL